MPVVNYQQYTKMLEAAYEGHYAYPAINVFSIDSANAALAAFAEAKSDGIIQVSIGGGEFASGPMVKNSALGAISIAEHIHRVADKYDVNIAIHTDHCKPEKLDSFVMPLIEETARRRKAGLPNLFNSHMLDGSEISLKENMEIAQKLLTLCAENEIVLEVEAGVVGGEEDGDDKSGTPNEKLYTTPEDMLYVYESLYKIPNAKFMLAATFGNVHGVYKPGNVKLNPEILNNGQKAIQEKYGKDAHFLLVFHGGSGSEKADIKRAVDYGVVKMNVDTDTQYAFTRPIVDHVMRNYDEVLRVDGEVGNKKKYDPRSYLREAEKGMSARIVEACRDLNSFGKTTFEK